MDVNSRDIFRNKLRDRIYKASVAIIKKDGLVNLSRGAVCRRCGISTGSFSYYAGVKFSDYVKQFMGDEFNVGESSSLKRISNSSVRKKSILNSYLKLAEAYGYKNVRIKDIASSAGITVSTITHHFKTIDLLRKELILIAIDTANIKILAQGISENDSDCMNIPKVLFNRAHKNICNVPKRNSCSIKRVNILNAAVRIANKKGVDFLTRKYLSEKAKVSGSTITYYFGSMDKLREEVGLVILGE